MYANERVWSRSHARRQISGLDHTRPWVAFVQRIQSNYDGHSQWSLAWNVIHLVYLH